MRWTLYAEKIKKYLPSPLYKLAAQAYIDYQFPRHIFLEITSRCNQSCSYCPRHGLGKDMDFEIYKKCVDEISRYGKRSVSLHLFGEPTMCKWFKDALRYLKAKGHTILLTTNGLLLQRYEDPVGKYVDKIIWTANKAAIPESLYGKLSVRFIEGIHSNEEIEAWKKKKVKIEIRRLHNYGGQLKSTAQNTGVKRYPCYHLWLAPSVSANGNILICCADPKEELILGNIKDMSISEAWDCDKLKALREEHRKGIYTSICEKCDVWLQYPSIF